MARTTSTDRTRFIRHNPLIAADDANPTAPREALPTGWRYEILTTKLPNTDKEIRYWGATTSDPDAAREFLTDMIGDKEICSRAVAAFNSHAAAVAKAGENGRMKAILDRLSAAASSNPDIAARLDEILASL